MGDRITITGVRAHGRHGVFDHERRDGQEFTADAVLHVDLRPAAASDDLAETADYGIAAQRMHDVLTGEPNDLIETVAERIAAELLAIPGVTCVEVTVHKPGAPIAVPFDDVSVSITRP